MDAMVGGPLNDDPYAIIPTSDGGIAIAGWRDGVQRHLRVPLLRPAFGGWWHCRQQKDAHRALEGGPPRGRAPKELLGCSRLRLRQASVAARQFRDSGTRLVLKQVNESEGTRDRRALRNGMLG